VYSGLSPPHSPSVLADAVASYDDVAVSVRLATTFIIAVSVTTAPPGASLPIPVSVPISIPPIAAIVPIPVHSRLRRSASYETAGEEASRKYNRQSLDLGHYLPRRAEGDTGINGFSKPSFPGQFRCDGRLKPAAFQLPHEDQARPLPQRCSCENQLVHAEIALAVRGT
jgi:hypothetical protein